MPRLLFWRDMVSALSVFNKEFSPLLLAGQTTLPVKNISNLSLTGKTLLAVRGGVNAGIH
jgi:hypothetical protein